MRSFLSLALLFEAAEFSALSAASTVSMAKCSTRSAWVTMGKDKALSVEVVGRAESARTSSRRR